MSCARQMVFWADVTLFPAPVAQRKSIGLLIRRSQVRILAGASAEPPAKPRISRGFVIPEGAEIGGVATQGATRGLSSPNATKLPHVTTIWTGPVLRAAAKYGENAPMATACCNGCRTCVTSNLLTLGVTAIAGAGYAVARFTRRVVAKPS